MRVVTRATPYELRLGWAVGQLCGVLKRNSIGTLTICLNRVKIIMTLLSNKLPAVKSSNILRDNTQVKWENTIQRGIFKADLNAEMFEG